MYQRTRYDLGVWITKLPGWVLLIFVIAKEFARSGQVACTLLCIIYCRTNLFIFQSLWNWVGISWLDIGTSTSITIVPIKRQFYFSQLSEYLALKWISGKGNLPIYTFHLLILNQGKIMKLLCCFWKSLTVTPKILFYPRGFPHQTYWKLPASPTDQSYRRVCEYKEHLGVTWKGVWADDSAGLVRWFLGRGRVGGWVAVRQEKKSAKTPWWREAGREGEGSYGVFWNVLGSRALRANRNTFPKMSQRVEHPLPYP